MSNQTPNLPVPFIGAGLPKKQKSDSSFWRAVPWLIIAITCLAMCSCAIPRNVTQLVEHTSVDTIYLSTQQYDSIYIYKDRVTDRSKDTVFLKDVSIEYRYKLLRDTVKVIQRDSIPYEVTITEIKEITRPLTLYDRLCRMCFWFLIGFLSLWLYNNFRKIRG